jgi:RNA polymerase sigma-70 factor (ECF subfamily)
MVAYVISGHATRLSFVSHLGSLVERVQAGENAAFSELVVATHGATFTLAFRLMGNEHDAADVVQEAYLRAYRSIDGFRGDASFHTWLYRITANCASSHLGKRTRDRTEQLTDHDVADVRAEHDPELLVDHSELREELIVAMESLPDHLRTVIVLRDVYDLTHADIATELGISVTAAKVRVHRARKRLREFVENTRLVADTAASESTEEGLRRAM